jgi:hypothetical protein
MCETIKPPLWASIREVTLAGGASVAVSIGARQGDAIIATLPGPSSLVLMNQNTIVSAFSSNGASSGVEIIVPADTTRIFVFNAAAGGSPSLPFYFWLRSNVPDAADMEYRIGKR